MDRLNLRISFIESVFMVVLALVYDGLQALVELITFGLGGWLINPFIDIWSFLTFYLWFKLKGISFVRPSRSLTLGGSFIVELIPWVNDLPTWTAGVIIMIAMVYAEDMVGSISPAAAQALASVLSNGRKGNVPQPAIA